MADLVMPKLGLTMTEGLLAEWKVGPGDKVAPGDIVFVVETDKIATEITAPSAGMITDIVVPAGEVVPVGVPVGHWTGTGAAEAAPQGPDPAPGPSPPAQDGKRIVATPLARRMARQRGIDLRTLRGSGPGGRIKAGDLEGAAVAPSPASTPRPPEQPRTGSRRAASRIESVAAERLSEAQRTIPRFHIGMEVNVGRLLELRGAIVAEGALPRVTLTHFLVAACVGALRTTPRAGARWEDGAIVTPDAIGIGIAVQTDRGLLAPIAHDLGGLGFAEQVERVDQAIARARDGKLAPDDRGGGIMTVSNLGMYDVSWLAPLVNPPQSSILGAGRAQDVFRPDAAGQPELRRELTLVLGADHRVLDGATAAAFLGEIKRRLENPLRLVV